MNRSEEFLLGESLPACWADALARRLPADTLTALADFVRAERAAGPVFPPAGEVFAAFRATPLDAVKVVLVGQDPYHGEGQAHGLSFSVRPEVKTPRSLNNIYRELRDDLGIEPPDHGHLVAWAKAGVLLLNTVLTVRAKSAGSHRRKGWEAVTRAALDALNERERPMVFLLWGRPAGKLGKRIDRDRHRVVEGVHPSPLSASRGFFGSRPFSAVNAALVELGQEPVDWTL